MHPRSASGFALVDVLAVVVCASVMLTIALPLVRSSRENATQKECADHLRKLGEGVARFSDANDKLLPYNQLAAPHGSWNTQLLPYIDQQKLADKYNPGHDWWSSKNSPNREVSATRVPVFQCPAAPNAERMVKTMDPDAEGGSFLAAPTDYVGSAGAYYENTQQKNLHPGAMHHRTLVKRLRVSDIVDGASQTLFLVEMADKPNSWQSGKLAEDRKEKPQQTALSGQWAAPNWNHLRSYSADGTKAFGPCSVNCSNSASIYGFHPDGANVLFVDGSVRLLKSSMSQELLIALVSYNGGEILSPEDY